MERFKKSLKFNFKVTNVSNLQNIPPLEETDKNFEKVPFFIGILLEKSFCGTNFQNFSTCSEITRIMLLSVANDRKICWREYGDPEGTFFFSLPIFLSEAHLLFFYTVQCKVVQVNDALKRHFYLISWFLFLHLNFAGTQNFLTVSLEISTLNVSEVCEISIQIEDFC